MNEKSTTPEDTTEDTETGTYNTNAMVNDDSATADTDDPAPTGSKFDM